MIVHWTRYKGLITAALVAIVASLVMAAACSSDIEDLSDVEGAKGIQVAEIAAPIENVEIVKLAAKPPNATLVIVSGGLNSCESFKDYELNRDGEVFRVQVTNLRTKAANVPCTTDYGIVEHNIQLPSNEIVGCETYQVEVNGAMFEVDASCPALAAGPAVGEMSEALAPIVGTEVVALESFPVQYRLHIESALPNGCIQFGGYDVSRQGEIIKVMVTNLEPADKTIACDQEFRTIKTTVSLGTGLDYLPSTAYTVEVNDVSTGFVTDAAAPGSAGNNPKLGEAFDLKVGETVTVKSDGLIVKLVEISEDSRCPEDVTCVWEGRALVSVIVSSPGDVLGFGNVDLTLEAGAIDAQKNRVVGDNASYMLTLLGLAPHPISTVKLTDQDYLATLEVAKVPLGR